MEAQMPIEVNREEVQELVAAGAQLVDVLSADEYAAEHIAGASNLPLKELNRETAARLDRDRPVIVYCWDYQ
jgi:rhodanese-related sulfurtransferase